MTCERSKLRFSRCVEDRSQRTGEDLDFLEKYGGPGLSFTAAGVGLGVVAKVKPADGSSLKEDLVRVFK